MPPTKKSASGKSTASSDGKVTDEVSGGSSIVRTLLRLTALCLVPYLLGVIASPRLLPIDILTDRIAPLVRAATSALQSPNAPSSSSPAPGPRPHRPHSPPAVSPEHSSTTATEEKERLRALMTSPQAGGYRTAANMEDGGRDPFMGVTIVVHRNGEPDPCARQVPDDKQDASPEQWSLTSRSLVRAANLRYEGQPKPLLMYDKYDFDAMLTDALAGGPKIAHAGKASLLIDRGASCGPQAWTPDADHLASAPWVSDMLKFCDMGYDRTPILPDHDSLVRLARAGSFPCQFHTREGLRISSIWQLAELARATKVAATGEGQCGVEHRDNEGNCSADSASVAATSRELHLYAVQAGRPFLFAPKYVGEIFELPHVKVPKDLPVWLEVMSLEPRVFDIYNFFDRQESADIVDKAMKETSESHRIKRSSTGASGYNVNTQRTSENGFDTHGKQAQAVKKRCMDILGFDTYTESLTDGLQVLRYNLTTAYVPHLDWIDDPSKKEEHDYDSAGKGSNRFATILLYMSDLAENDGGETVFAKGWPADQPVEERVMLPAAMEALRASGDVKDLLKRGSWEERMVAQCRSRLSIRPHSSRAVLFYSQNPDGTVDNNSLHGGCPVIGGEKWAANLWVWNAPRGGFPGAPMNEEVVQKNRDAGRAPDDGQRKASFTNGGKDIEMKNAKLFFQETYWGDLGHGDPMLNVNTFEGHKWYVRVDGRIVREFNVDNRPQQQFFI